MSKAEWGLKRICPGCGTRYYDMKKNPPVCPGCGTVFDPENLLRTRRGRAPEKKAPVKDAADDVIDDLPLTDDASEDALIEDAEELADEDVEEVVEIGTEDEES